MSEPVFEPVAAAEPALSGLFLLEDRTGPGVTRDVPVGVTARRVPAPIADGEATL